MRLLKFGVAIMLIAATLGIMPTASATYQALCGNDGIIRMIEDTSNNGSWVGNCRYATPEIFTYTVSLPNPPFNYSAEWPANDTITAFTMNAGWKNEESFSIEDTSEYSIIYEYNDGETLDFNFRYEKHGWGVFGYWKTVYSFAYNGDEFCNYEQNEYNGRNRISTHTMVRLGGHSTIPPGLSGLHYNDVDNLTAPTEVEYTYSDYTTPNAYSKLTGIASYWSDPIKNTTPCFHDESNMTFPFTHLSAPISVTFTTTEDDIRPIFIAGSFANKTMEAQHYRNFIDGLDNFIEGLEENDLFCQGGFFAFTFCFASTTIISLIGWIFSLVGTIVSAMFSIFPYGNELYNVLSYPVDISMEIFLTLFEIYFMPGEGYGPGGTYLSLWVWSACFGSGLAAITGNLRYMWSVPWGFLKYSTIGVAYAAYLIYYKIPKEGLTTLMDGIKIARGG